MSEYDCTPTLLADRIRKEGALAVVLSFDGDAIDKLEEALTLSLDGGHPHTLRAALLAQIEVSTRTMRKLGLNEQEIADCTAQARAALALHQQPAAAQPVTADQRREQIAKAIYALDPHQESGEYVDGFAVSPGGALTWEEACRRDAEFADVLPPITKFAYDAADAALTALERNDFARGEAHGIERAARYLEGTTESRRFGAELRKLKPSQVADQSEVKP